MTKAERHAGARRTVFWVCAISCCGLLLALIIWYSRAGILRMEEPFPQHSKSGPRILASTQTITPTTVSLIAPDADISFGLAGSGSKSYSPPALETPVAAFFEEASRRAADGDRQAACRLGFDLALCAEIDELRDSEQVFLGFSATMNSPGAQTGIVEHLSRIRESIARAERVCEGLKPEQIAASWRFLVRAAEMGDDDAAAYFVLSPPMSTTDFLSDLDGWNYYRNNHERLMEEAIARGNPQALFSLQRSAFGLPPIPQLVRHGADTPTDALRGLTYSLVLSRLSDVPNAAGFERNAAMARTSLTAAQIRSAEKAADQIYERSFKQHRNLDFESGPTRDFDAKKCYDD